MALRLGVDLDGTVADLGSRLSALSGEPEPAAVLEPVARGPEDEAGGDPPTIRGFVNGADALLDTPHLRGAAPDVWSVARATENFWESLEEVEPGAVRALADLVRARDWEIIFITSRPASEGVSTQLQSQRWLVDNGFDLPSVFVSNGSRGEIAKALGLDVVVDDHPENCIDVATDSSARAVLVWRGSNDAVPNGIKKLGIGAVASMSECLALLERLDDRGGESGLRGAFRRLFGVRGR